MSETASKRVTTWYESNIKSYSMEIVQKKVGVFVWHGLGFTKYIIK